MIHFPPARFPTDSRLGIEPLLPDKPERHEGKPPAAARADQAVFAAGLRSLRGRMLMTSQGAVVQVIEAGISDGWTAKYFLWDGRTRRIEHAATEAGRKALLDLLGDAWPYGHGEGDGLYDEAQLRLAKALAYEKMDDIELVAMNFDLLREKSGLVLSTPCLREGELNGLHATFCYCGRKRFPVSALLEAWDEGQWRVGCCAGKHGRHEAFVISGGGGLSMGVVMAYCPVCGKTKRIETSIAPYFGRIMRRTPERHDGYRLDEIIEELGGRLPGQKDGGDRAGGANSV